jgi:hypothetical protein
MVALRVAYFCWNKKIWSVTGGSISTVKGAGKKKMDALT